MMLNTMISVFLEQGIGVLTLTAQEAGLPAL